MDKVLIFLKKSKQNKNQPSLGTTYRLLPTTKGAQREVLHRKLETVNLSNLNTNQFPSFSSLLTDTCNWLVGIQ